MAEDILLTAADRLDERAHDWGWDRLAAGDALFMPALAEHLREIAARHPVEVVAGIRYCGWCGEATRAAELPCPDRVSAEKLARTVVGQ